MKKAESGIVVNPVTVRPDQSLPAAVELMRHHDISGLPVVEADGRPVGILTTRDIRFERNLDQPVSALMTSSSSPSREGTTLEAAKELLHKNRIEKLLVVDGEGMLRASSRSRTSRRRSRPARGEGRARPAARRRRLGLGPDRDERVDALSRRAAT